MVWFVFLSDYAAETKTTMSVDVGVHYLSCCALLVRSIAGIRTRRRCLRRRRRPPAPTKALAASFKTIAEHKRVVVAYVVTARRQPAIAEKMLYRQSVLGKNRPPLESFLYGAYMDVV